MRLALHPLASSSECERTCRAKRDEQGVVFILVIIHHPGQTTPAEADGTPASRAQRNARRDGAFWLFPVTPYTGLDGAAGA